MILTTGSTRVTVQVTILIFAGFAVGIMIGSILRPLHVNRAKSMYRDPETKDAIKFVPFKGVIQEYAPFYGLSTDTAT